MAFGLCESCAEGRLQKSVDVRLQYRLLNHEYQEEGNHTQSVLAGVARDIAMQECSIMEYEKTSVGTSATSEPHNDLKQRNTSYCGIMNSITDPCMISNSLCSQHCAACVQLLVGIQSEERAHGDIQCLCCRLSVDAMPVSALAVLSGDTPPRPFLNEWHHTNGPSVSQRRQGFGGIVSLSTYLLEA